MEKLPSSKKQIPKYASTSGTKSATIALALFPAIVIETIARYLISNYISKTSMEKLPSSKNEIPNYASISGIKSATIALSCSVSSNSNTKGRQIFCESCRTQGAIGIFFEQLAQDFP
jgi:hypothetical protein